MESIKYVFPWLFEHNRQTRIWKTQKTLKYVNTTALRNNICIQMYIFRWDIIVGTIMKMSFRPKNNSRICYWSCNLQSITKCFSSSLSHSLSYNVIGKIEQRISHFYLRSSIVMKQDWFFSIDQYWSFSAKFVGTIHLPVMVSPGFT